MNTTQTGVEYAVDLSFMMETLSAKMLQNGDEKYEGMLDLKTHYRGVKYALEAIKIVQEKADTILIKEAIEEIKERKNEQNREYPSVENVHVCSLNWRRY